eukprot:909302_1
MATMVINGARFWFGHAEFEVADSVYYTNKCTCGSCFKINVSSNSLAHCRRSSCREAQVRRDLEGKKGEKEVDEKTEALLAVESETRIRIQALYQEVKPGLLVL